MSFAARQRDIAEMVGEEFIGPEHEHLRNALSHWHGRFNEIKLGDKNLPEIVEKRVVLAKDAAARKTLDDAFEKLRGSLRGTTYGTLLGKEGDERDFRKVYPFSPALIETLIALSHLLQRERTALKVLMELLVEHLPRHLPDFALGDVVPVGELYDVLAAGEEPMDGAMRQLFRPRIALVHQLADRGLHCAAELTFRRRAQRAIRIEREKMAIDAARFVDVALPGVSSQAIRDGQRPANLSAFLIAQVLERGSGTPLIVVAQVGHVELVVVAFQDAIDHHELTERALDLFAEEARQPGNGWAAEARLQELLKARLVFFRRMARLVERVVDQQAKVVVYGGPELNVVHLTHVAVFLSGIQSADERVTIARPQ